MSPSTLPSFFFFLAGSPPFLFPLSSFLFPAGGHLDKLQKQPQIGFQEDSSTRRQIKEFSTQIDEHFQACRKNIHDIEPPPKGTVEQPAETKARVNAQISLATSLQALSYDYHKKQSAHKEGEPGLVRHLTLPVQHFSLVPLFSVLKIWRKFRRETRKLRPRTK